MKNKQIFTSTFTIILISSIIFFMADQPSSSACILLLGKKSKIDMEISPKIPLFNPEKDGYFYPGSPKITKYLKIINVGNLPFRICMINATFEGDIYLATGLQIEILELGRGIWEKPNLLYNGTLSNLGEGLKVYGKRVVPPKGSVMLQISVWMPPTAGNEYQGLTVTADISITVCFPPSHGRMKC